MGVASFENLDVSLKKFGLLVFFLGLGGGRVYFIFVIIEYLVFL